MLKLFHSRIPTSIVPLAEFRRVTVLLDATAPDFEKAWNVALTFFGKTGSELTVVPVERKGLIRTSRKTDVLISLLPVHDWRSRYVVCRSQAKFKIGRGQFDKPVFDLVVSDPEGRQFPQSEVLEKIFDILRKLK